MKTAIVILNWNTEDFIEKFLPGLVQTAESAGNAEVVVADNASTDGSMRVMHKSFPSIKTIEFEKNHGFTGGYNRAFKEICSTPEGPEYFLLINSDIEVTEGWLQPLVDWMDSHPECGACAPKLHSWYVKDSFEYAGAAGGYIDKFGYPFCRGRVLKRVENDHGQYDSATDVFWATGACLLVRASLYEKLGGLDERFFAHMEEIDLCWKLQLEGYKVTVVPDSVVYHVGGGTLPQSSPFKLFLNYRNNLLMLKNNLAKTIALKHYRTGLSAETAARKGKKCAAQVISFRMLLDIVSSLVYLLTLNVKGFKAVLKAHKEYRKLKTDITTEDIQKYLCTVSYDTSVKGIYKKWIVLQSILKGKEIFSSIKENDFHKF